MAARTIFGTGDRYPSGTTVTAYERRQEKPGQAPSGSPVASAVASVDSVTFDALSPDTEYSAYAVIAGEHRYTQFRTAEEASLSGGHIIQDESSDLPMRGRLAFQGSGLSASDDSVNDRTIVSAAGGGGTGGHTIEDESSTLPQRSRLRFAGDGVAASDDAGGDRTVVTVPGAAGPAGGVLSGAYPNPGFAADMATQAEFDAHLNVAVAAHMASAIGVSPTVLGGDDVQEVLAALAAAVAKPTVPFTWDQGTDESAAIGSSRAIRIPNASTVVRCVLSCTSAPVGSGLTCEFRSTDGVMATLTIPAGSTVEQVATALTLNTPSAGEYIWPNFTSVGSTTPAKGVLAQMDVREN